MRALASATFAAADERTPAAIGRLTGLAYTLRNGAMRARVQQVTKESYELGAEWLAAFGRRELPMRPEHWWWSDLVNPSEVAAKVPAATNPPAAQQLTTGDRSAGTLRLVCADDFGRVDPYHSHTAE